MGFGNTLMKQVWNKYGKVVARAAAMLLFILFSATEVIAPNHIDWSTEQSMDYGDFEENFLTDPAGALQSNPARAWQVLESSPEYLTRPEVLPAAFDADPTRAVGVINKNVVLLDNTDVQNAFENAVVKDINLANNHPAAKGAWLGKKYQIGMQSSNTEMHSLVHSPDGIRITLGESKTTFTPADVPGAIVRENGCLELQGNVFCSTNQMSYARNPESNQPLFTNNKNNYYASGGIIRLQEDVHEAYLFIDDSMLVVDKDVGFVDYKGSFRFARTQEGNIITAEGCALVCSEGNAIIRETRLGKTTFTGTILEPSGAKMDEFIIMGSSTLKVGEGSILNVKSDSRVYYTGEQERNAHKFCNSKFSCVVNTPSLSSFSGILKVALEFRNIQHGDEISVASNAYYDRVLVDNIINGEVRYFSLSEKGNYVSEIAVNNREGIKVRGELKNTNAGRVDFVRKRDGKRELQHWSSNGNRYEKAVADYFRGKEEHFVTCTAGVDCEQRFAENFGKVVGPRGKRPESTIVVAGDFVSVARSLEKSRGCQENGCYVLDSRDMPPVTKSRNLIVTGHHFGGDDAIWRDSPVKDGFHTPIDRIYLDEFPEGPVETLTLSACNSALESEITVLSMAAQRYPSLKVVQGWDGTAPAHESIEHIVSRTRAEPQQVPAVYESEGRVKGTRAWYVKQDNDWLWTDDGVDCSDGRTIRPCRPPLVALRPTRGTSG